MFLTVYLLRQPAKPARRSEAARSRSEAALKWAKLIALSMALMGAARAQIALEPDTAGPDFKIQGEYLGTITDGSPMGAQVIALGSGRFTAVFLPGGLPGEGWNGSDRFEAAGTATGGGPAVVSGSGFSGSVAAQGTLFTGKTDQDQDFTLAKILRTSPTEGAAPPSGAAVLFDGKDVSAWKDGTAGMDARKLFKPEGASAASGAITKATFGTFHLHLEFRIPFMPAASGQR
ncbi:MAG: hypothetical protein ABI036_05950, partial [Fibrobacteria bacterium]